MSVLLVVDGMTDLKRKTPEEIASGLGLEMPGAWGWFSTCPPGFRPESMTCILTLLGVSEKDLPRTGRAYLEAQAAGIEVGPEDLVFRCNLAKTSGEVLTSSCAEGLTAGEKKAMENRFSEMLKGIGEFFSLGGYKNLLVVRGAGKEETQVKTWAPHENCGKPVEAILPQGGNLAQQLRSASLETWRKFGQEFLLIPWGQSAGWPLPQFSELHGCGAGAVCRTEIAKGIALAMGMETPELTCATADTDTDLREKAETARRLFEKYPFVLVHVNGADEASHRRNKEEKERFLCRVGKELAEPLQELPGKLLVCSDHMTLPETGEHRDAPQPFLLFGEQGGNYGTLPGTKAAALLLGKGKG